MAIGSYPRVTVQGTSNTQNPQNGFGLMVFNSVTGKYEAATEATFGGGSGGATEAKQDAQIALATILNTFLESGGQSTAEILLEVVNQLTTLNAALTNGSARVVLQDTTGTLVDVDSTAKALLVKTTA